VGGGGGGGFNWLKKWYMWDGEAFEELPFGICTLKALKDLKFK